MSIVLSPEQDRFVNIALSGWNILVDACIGSGKTTAIQELCRRIPINKNILYLTYNRLLKVDAKSRIHGRNITVTNYHGFAYRELCYARAQAGVSDCIQAYNQLRPQTARYDVLLLDEYQDIEQEMADMLRHIKACNPGMQVIAVGDMAQKIYDKTRLDASVFIREFLGPHYDLEFTQCFRLSDVHAAMLGRIWKKEIHGVNPDCKVIKGMKFRDILAFLSRCEPREVLVLGSNTGTDRNKLLNRLEKDFPDIYNKQTVWSKTSDHDGGATEPTAESAVFTTYDGCKGMERDVCVLFDWSADYWASRSGKPGVKAEILRNIFLVAASRGKHVIIFAETDIPLSERTLSDAEDTGVEFSDVQISTMFDFKYIEDVEAAYCALDITEDAPKGEPIETRTSDALIDLSACIGIYQEGLYFESCRMETYIENWFEMNPSFGYLRREEYTDWSLDQQVLYLVSLETRQNRYLYQVGLPLVSEDTRGRIRNRLSSLLPVDAPAQVECALPFIKNGELLFAARGFADVIYDDTVYELKFVSELLHTHYLQCACYMVARGIAEGVLWNIRTGQRMRIRIPDKDVFLGLVAKAVTKGRISSDALVSGRIGKGSGNDSIEIEKKQSGHVNERRMFRIYENGGSDLKRAVDAVSVADALAKAYGLVGFKKATLAEMFDQDAVCIRYADSMGRERSLVYKKAGKKRKIPELKRRKRQS